MKVQFAVGVLVSVMSRGDFGASPRDMSMGDRGGVGGRSAKGGRARGTVAKGYFESSGVFVELDMWTFGL